MWAVLNNSIAPPAPKPPVWMAAQSLRELAMRHATLAAYGQPIENIIRAAHEIEKFLKGENTE